MKTKIRNYGWYCTRCHEHKPINKVRVVKTISKNSVGGWFGTICAECNTVLSDCFVVKNYYPNLKLDCNICEDRFQCFTLSESQIEKELETVFQHEITMPAKVFSLDSDVGIRSYTGKINDKLDYEYCLFPERDDCNFSRMRVSYTGEPYDRCSEMKYDTNKKKWFCRYGKKLRCS